MKVKIYSIITAICIASQALAVEPVLVKKGEPAPFDVYGYNMPDFKIVTKDKAQANKNRRELSRMSNEAKLGEFSYQLIVEDRDRLKKGRTLDRVFVGTCVIIWGVIAGLAVKQGFK